ncbi:GlsB/YeaQ/YmgE family stress response membrane protein [Streptomyces orinoci]|uniref:GlsB/YeaQ/YmgE family stress response membrane protein n=1 Tax=Streptomyces orinoci TaxID=67339 RepID=A0ABV3JXY8_STRON|nr:GlsB/YeaQ/YmgE family stress response membrane protein [Streptomyces orinoci]
MSWVWAIIVGLVLGLIAKVIIPGKQAIPLWLTMLCGLAGALLGNWGAEVLGVRHTHGVDWIRHLLQLAGAVIVVALANRLWTGVRDRRGERVR